VRLSAYSAPMTEPLQQAQARPRISRRSCIDATHLAAARRRRR